MHSACAGIHGDKIGRQHDRLSIEKGMLRFKTRQLFAQSKIQTLGSKKPSVDPKLIVQLVGDNNALALIANNFVFRLWIHRDGEIGGKRPGSCCPDSDADRSEEHTSELQSRFGISY